MDRAANKENDVSGRAGDQRDLARGPDPHRRAPETRCPRWRRARSSRSASRVPATTLSRR